MSRMMSQHAVLQCFTLTLFRSSRHRFARHHHYLLDEAQLDGEADRHLCKLGSVVLLEVFQRVFRGVNVLHRQRYDNTTNRLSNRREGTGSRAQSDQAGGGGGGGGGGGEGRTGLLCSKALSKIKAEL